MEDQEVVTRNDGGKEVDEHPAFGMICLTRTQSTGMFLAGSSVKHGNYISLEIKEGQRSLQRDHRLHQKGDPMSNDTLGDRQKDYEKRNRRYLARKVPVLMRLDGKAFHTFTRGCEKPFDMHIINAMQSTTEYLVSAIQGAKVGYVQSDEITLLLTDFDNIETEAWFDYCQNKMESVAASMASVHFTLEYARLKAEHANYPVDHKEAHFDCRAWNHPKEDVMNNFRWRYQDWSRNSIQMLARSLYSHNELHKKKNADLHEMCFQKGYNWANLPGECKNGTLCVRTFEGVVRVTDFNLNDNDFCDRLFNQFLYPSKD